MSFTKTMTVPAVLAVLIGGGLSPSSSHPDGLEWSMERTTASTEVEAKGSIYESAENIQNTAAILPDYALKNSNTVLGTAFSGIAGGFVVLGVCAGACYAFEFFRKKKLSGMFFYLFMLFQLAELPICLQS